MDSSPGEEYLRLGMVPLPLPRLRLPRHTLHFHCCSHAPGCEDNHFHFAAVAGRGRSLPRRLDCCKYYTAEVAGERRGPQPLDFGMCCTAEAAAEDRSFRGSDGRCCIEGAVGDSSVVVVVVDAAAGGAGMVTAATDCVADRYSHLMTENSEIEVVRWIRPLADWPAKAHHEPGGTHPLFQP